MYKNRIIKELEKYNPNAKIKMHDKFGNDLVRVSYIPSSNSGDSVIFLEDKEDVKKLMVPPNFTVKNLIDTLNKIEGNSRVKMHSPKGNNVLFVIQYIDSDTVIIEDLSDNDLSTELDERFKCAAENQLDELDFFLELDEIGITLEDIYKNLPEKYEYSKTFIIEHGLI